MGVGDVDIYEIRPDVSKENVLKLKSNLAEIGNIDMLTKVEKELKDRLLNLQSAYVSLVVEKKDLVDNFLKTKNEFTKSLLLKKIKQEQDSLPAIINEFQKLAGIAEILEKKAHAMDKEDKEFSSIGKIYSAIKIVVVLFEMNLENTAKEILILNNNNSTPEKIIEAFEKNKNAEIEMYAKKIQKINLVEINKVKSYLNELTQRVNDKVRPTLEIKKKWAALLSESILLTKMGVATFLSPEKINK